jgi:hypothetical protein
MIRNIQITDGCLTMIRQRLEKCSRLYQTLHANDRVPNGHLRASLVSFAEVVIEFHFVIGDILSHGPFSISALYVTIPALIINLLSPG